MHKLKKQSTGSKKRLAEKHANVATRGWFRIDPGQCRQVVDGALDADMVYVYGRTPPVYGTAPLPQNGQAEFCIRDGDFGWVAMAQLNDPLPNKRTTPRADRKTGQAIRGRAIRQPCGTAGRIPQQSHAGN